MPGATTARKARAFVAGLSLFCAASFCAPARADGPLGGPGERIGTSDYTIDLFQGPTLASSRVTAMGGSYSAIAEGAEGIPFNAGAASQRQPYSTTHFDYDLTAGVTFPSSVRNTDFDNNGRVGFDYDNFIFATVGGMIQLGRWGFGTAVSLQNYSLGALGGGEQTASSIQSFTTRIFKVDAVLSYGFLDQQLHVGGGLRGAIFTAVDTSVFERLLFGTYGAGAQGSVLWTPHGLPIRVGGTIRSPILASLEVAPNVDDDGADRVIGVPPNAFYLPRGGALPWELEWGIAAQIGKRPLNVPFVDEDAMHGEEVEDERRMQPGDRHEPPRLEPAYKAARRLLKSRYAGLARRKLLVSFSALVTGPTEGAVGIESMLTQYVDRSGKTGTLTLRAGAEAEVIPNRLQLRAGSYLEPTRFRDLQFAEVVPGPERTSIMRSRDPRSRLHGTAGFEVRVLEWSVFGLFADDTSFRISGAIDASRQYFGWSLGAGIWH
ncbi:MAG: hypothetical protein KF819_37005 [Labilithrix sp.]|nr:hypothetical protein [Labilithrix sp.]